MRKSWSDRWLSLKIICCCRCCMGMGVRVSIWLDGRECRCAHAVPKHRRVEPMERHELLARAVPISHLVSALGSRVPRQVKEWVPLERQISGYEDVVCAGCLDGEKSQPGWGIRRWTTTYLWLVFPNWSGRTSGLRVSCASRWPSPVGKTQAHTRTQHTKNVHGANTRNPLKTAKSRGLTTNAVPVVLWQHCSSTDVARLCYKAAIIPDSNKPKVEQKWLHY